MEDVKVTQVEQTIEAETNWLVLEWCGDCWGHYRLYTQKRNAFHAAAMIARKAIVVEINTPKLEY